MQTDKVSKNCVKSVLCLQMSNVIWVKLTKSATFEAMMKRVVSALRCARVLAMCVPSILDTNHTCGPPFEYGFRDSVTIRGP